MEVDHVSFGEIAMGGDVNDFGGGGILMPGGQRGVGAEMHL